MLGAYSRTLASISMQISVFIPAFNALNPAICMVTPSALGSEKGIPNSRASAPASIKALISLSDCSAFGSPMITKGIKAFSFFVFNSAKAC